MTVCPVGSLEVNRRGTWQEKQDLDNRENREDPVANCICYSCVAYKDFDHQLFIVSEHKINCKLQGSDY